MRVIPLIFFPMPRSAILLILVSLATFSAACGQTWKTLSGCRLAEGEYADGDSFHVKQGGKDYVFRLYFCDTPETDKRFPDRVRTQAKYFGITQKNVIAAGNEAQAFTQSILSSPFTVITKWEDARGESHQERFYAIVLIGQKNLAELLVSAGWARSYGMLADYPTARQGKDFRDHLDKLEASAKESKKGAWGLATSKSPPKKTTTVKKTKPSPPTTAEDRLDQQMSGGLNAILKDTQ